VTGLLGGFVSGQTPGFVYSTLGLTVGTLLAFAGGRWLGSAFVRRLVSPDVWHRLGLGHHHLLPHLPHPRVPEGHLCYLLGLSPTSFWVFAATSTLGRMPDTWILSPDGAETAGGHYVATVVLTVAAAAVTVPLDVYRHQLVHHVDRRAAPRPGAPAR
jgi:uncharacterized membrane protein YdjX (TVP38/TMEM64 family)